MVRSTLLAGFCVAAIAGCAIPQQVDLLVTNVTVYSGEAEAPFKASVAVKDGTFAAINRDGSEAFKAKAVIIGNGLYMTPGLWDMHVHVAVVEADNIDVAEFLTHGVTSVRDCGGFPERIDATREAIAMDATLGPTIYAAGPTLNGESFAGFQRALTSEDEVRDAVKELANWGADFIKIHRAFKPELLPVVIEAAHQSSLKVTGHIPLGVSPLEACEAGMDGIEHVGSFIESYASIHPEGGNAGGLAYMQSDEATPLYQCLAERGVFVDPTLVVYPAVARNRIGDEPMPPEFIAFIDSLKAVTLRLRDSGVLLVTGTDSAAKLEGAIAVPPGLSLHDELEMLQASGIPAQEIIVMATLNPARVLGVEATTGSIAVGKAADFLLLNADPGVDVANFRKLHTVHKAEPGVLR